MTPPPPPPTPSDLGGYCHHDRCYAAPDPRYYQYEFNSFEEVHAMRPEALAALGLVYDDSAQRALIHQIVLEQYVSTPFTPTINWLTVCDELIELSGILKS